MKNEYVRPGDEDTICALATAPGVGAIAVVRISGDRSLAVCRKLAPFLPDSPESHRAYFGTVQSPEGRILDEALVTFFKNGSSFTGEESLEVSVHGGDLISGQIIDCLIQSGARMAKPGEFTYRAFMNDKIDLVQAESVLSLIESQSKSGAEISLHHLKGGLSKKFLAIEDDLVWLGAQLEAGIDFSSDGIEPDFDRELLPRARKLGESLESLLKTFDTGRVLTKGLKIALIGAPNAGKSSLLNAILEEERAIVTSKPGTTRDLIQVDTRENGTPVSWVDTAGLRSLECAEDEAEQIGIRKSKEIQRQADFNVYVIDLSQSNWRYEFERIEEFIAEKTWVFFNKTDLPFAKDQVDYVKDLTKELGITKYLFGSAKTGDGVSEFKNSILAPVRLRLGVSDSAAVITQSRHFEGLTRIRRALGKAVELMEVDASSEIVAFELDDGVRAVHELLGKVYHEQIIDRIFKEFCLGK